MHNVTFPQSRKIARGLIAFLATAILLVVQQKTVWSQVTASITNAPSPAGVAEVRTAPNPNVQSQMVSVPQDFAALKLAPGFLLNIEVYGEPDLSGHVRVDSEGNISLPFMKSLQVANGTITQAQDKIQQRFREQAILNNPQVTINVEQFATTSAMVLGEVQYPGRVELLAPHSLLDVIGLTGGETPLAGNEVEVKPEDASGKAIRVYHYSRGSNGDAIRNVMVKPGDTVIVKRAGIVYVLGAVNRPGGYPMQEDGELNVAQAISLAQGMAMQARTGGLRVVKHSVDGQPINVPVSYNRMMNGKEIPMNLAAGDIVYVPVSKIKTVFTTSSSLIGETAAATIYK